MKRKKMIQTFLVLAIASSLLVGCGNGKDEVGDVVVSQEVSSEEEVKVDPLETLSLDVQDLKVELEILTDLVENGFKNLESKQEALDETAEIEEEGDTEVAESNPLEILPEEEDFDLQEVLNIKSIIFANAVATEAKDIDAFKATIINPIAEQEDFEKSVIDAFALDEANFTLEKIKVISLDDLKAVVEVTQITEFTKGEKEDNKTIANWQLSKDEGSWKIGEISTFEMIFNDKSPESVESTEGKEEK